MKLIHTPRKIKSCGDCIHFEGTCPFFRDIDYNDPSRANCCRYFYRIEGEHALYTDELLFNEDLGFSITGSKFTNESYPKAPQFPLWLRVEGVYWYNGIDKQTGIEFGCWVLNKSLKPLKVVNTKEEAIKGWADNVYKSPVPLHHHNASENLLATVCWCIAEDGYGMYGVLVGNDIGYVTFPRPKHWRLATTI